MSEDYQKLILEKIKIKVNDWISELKTKHKELMLTHQWQVLFPKGFSSGFVSMPVVTGSKNGKHLVGMVEFVVPNDITLDVDDIELILKNEPFKEHLPDSTDVADHIDILNNIVTGLNEFISGLKINNNVEKKMPGFFSHTAAKSAGSQPIPLRGSDDDLCNSPNLPSWIKNITEERIKTELVDKLSNAWKQHKSSSIGPADMGEFMSRYTMHLLNHGHLHHFCSYKGKPVKLDNNQWCTESFCSKKPWQSPCPIVQLKFGKE